MANSGIFSLHPQATTCNDKGATDGTPFDSGFFRAHPLPDGADGRFGAIGWRRCGVAWKKVRVVLENHCFKCHSHQAGKNKARACSWIPARRDACKGGDTGPAIVPGHPEKSLLVKAISYVDEDPAGIAAPAGRNWLEMRTSPY